jgi:hypothetical protein
MSERLTDSTPGAKSEYEHRGKGNGVMGVRWFRRGISETVIAVSGGQIVGEVVPYGPETERFWVAYARGDRLEQYATEDAAKSAVEAVL